MSFTLPVIGNTVNAWGGLINTIFETINGYAIYPNLVADGGVTDNTAALVAAEAAAHALGGAVIYIPSSGGSAFGCNFATTYNSIKWQGVTLNNPSTANTPSTFCGLNSLIGTQNSVWDVESNSVTLEDLDFNAGTHAADNQGASSYLCDKALIVNATDICIVNCSPRNGTYVSYWETPNSKRAKYHMIRPSQPQGNNNPTYYLSATKTYHGQVGQMFGNVVAGGFQFTITDGVNTFVAPSNTATPWTSISDVGRQISGPGITPGTYIHVVNSSTNCTLSQQCNPATGVAVLEYQSDNILLQGSDSLISNSVMNYGTKRYQGSGQISGTHNTFSGVSGCNNVIIEGGSTYQIDNLYCDSSPETFACFNDGVANGTTTYTSATAAFTAADTGNFIAGQYIPIGTTMTYVNATTVTLSSAATNSGSALAFQVYARTLAQGCALSSNLVHTHLTSGPGTATASTAITNLQCFMITVGNSQPMIIENETSCSLNITGGISHAATAQHWTCIIAETWGANTSFQLVNYNINTANAVAQSSGYPVTFLTGTSPFSGAAYGAVAGQLSFVQGGVTYGAFSAAWTPPGKTTATAYQNLTGYPVYVSLNFTATSAAATASLVIGPTSSPATNFGTWTPAITAAVGTLNATVPPGWYYEFTYSNCTAGTIVGIG